MFDLQLQSADGSDTQAGSSVAIYRPAADDPPCLPRWGYGRRRRRDRGCADRPLPRAHHPVSRRSRANPRN